VTVCVIDASVAAKWFLPASGETLTAEALGMLESYEEDAAAVGAGPVLAGAWQHTLESGASGAYFARVGRGG